MVRIILLIVLTAIWIRALINYDGRPHCDQCLGDDCPFPEMDCERRK